MDKIQTALPFTTQPRTQGVKRQVTVDLARKIDISQNKQKSSSVGNINPLTVLGLLFGSSVALAGGTHVKGNLFGAATKYLRLISTLSSIFFGTVLATAGLEYSSKNKNSNGANISIY